jgi:hypothetical protein
MIVTINILFLFLIFLFKLESPKWKTFKIFVNSTGKVYNETLESVKKSFPQYIRELEGTADGAQVEFHKVLKHKNKQPPRSSIYHSRF